MHRQRAQQKAQPSFAMSSTPPQTVVDDGTRAAHYALDLMTARAERLPMLRAFGNLDEGVLGVSRLSQVIMLVLTRRTGTAAHQLSRACCNAVTETADTLPPLLVSLRVLRLATTSMASPRAASSCCHRLNRLLSAIQTEPGLAASAGCPKMDPRHMIRPGTNNSSTLTHCQTGFCSPNMSACSRTTLKQRRLTCRMSLPTMVAW